jgi:hypothetical protein
MFNTICRSRSRIALWFLLRPKDVAPSGSGSATLVKTNNYERFFFNDSKSKLNSFINIIFADPVPHHVGGVRVDAVQASRHMF